MTPPTMRLQMMVAVYFKVKEDIGASTKSRVILAYLSGGEKQCPIAICGWGLPHQDGTTLMVFSSEILPCWINEKLTAAPTVKALMLSSWVVKVNRIVIAGQPTAAIAS